MEAIVHFQKYMLGSNFPSKASQFPGQTSCVGVAHSGEAHNTGMTLSGPVENSSEVEV
jgi:hypothetical protein